MTSSKLGDGSRRVVGKDHKRSTKTRIVLRAMFRNKCANTFVQIGRRFERLGRRVIESDERIPGKFAAVLDALEQTGSARPATDSG